MWTNGNINKGDYLGIVIAQSLIDGEVKPPARILGKKHLNTWDFLLVAVVDTALDEHIHMLQANMVTETVWYAHYFRNQQLVVVFRDSFFRASLDKSTWEPIIKYGLKKGIPLEQLDFNPATERSAIKFFDMGEIGKDIARK